MSERRTSSAGRRILQIAYYDNLLRTRAVMLQQSGYVVASVLGNEEAKAAVARHISQTDLVMVGFSGPFAERSAITRWLKKEFPTMPVVVLQASSSERFPEADCVTLSEDPEVWIDAVASCLQRFSRD